MYTRKFPHIVYSSVGNKGQQLEISIMSTHKWMDNNDHILTQGAWMTCCSVAQSCPTICDPMDYSTPGFPVLYQILELAQTHVYWVYHPTIQLSHPLLPPSPPPSIFPSIRVFSNESALCIRWPKYWGFSFSISPSNKYSGLISFRIDRSDLLAAQGTLKSLHQHHSSKASILQLSAFFMAQLSHPYMTTGVKKACCVKFDAVGHLMKSKPKKTK